jgi:hypothetical protein
LKLHRSSSSVKVGTAGTAIQALFADTGASCTQVEEMKNYGIEHFNQFGVLKIHPLLVLVFVYLTRYSWISIAVLLSRSPELMQRFLDGSLKYLIAAEVPALLVALAGSNRSPTANRLIRAIWRVGAWATALSALVTAMLLPVLPDFRFNYYRVDDLILFEVALNIACIVYLMLPMIRETFAEFPAPPPPEAAKP